MSDNSLVRRRAGILTALVASVLLAGCSGGTEEPAEASVLENCSPRNGPVDAMCATIEVFEDRAVGSGRKIALKVVVFPACQRDPAPDPLFVLVGGPGQAAAAISETLMRFFEGVQETRDVVFVDQRGTGDSNPLTCSFDEDDLSALSRVRFPVEDLKECLEGFDADTRFYTTPVAMDDLNQVREELAYDRINLWGGSYGTRAALVYLRRHGETVRSVVLDGVAPPGMRLPLAFPADGQRALDLMLKSCEADVECNVRFPEIRPRFERLWARLDAAPREVTLRHARTAEEVEVTLRRELVSGILMGALYSPEMSALLPLLIERAEEDDFQGFMALASLNENLQEQMSLGMFFSVLCAEDLPWIEKAEAEEAAAGTFLGTAAYTAWTEACEVWPAAEMDEAYHDSVESEVPVLVLSGELDPVTPPHWGDQAAETLPNSRHVVVPGIGHGTTAMGCVPNLIAEFIDKGTAEEIDAACVERRQRPPFFLTNAGPVAEAGE